MLLRHASGSMQKPSLQGDAITSSWWWHRHTKWACCKHRIEPGRPAKMSPGFRSMLARLEKDMNAIMTGKLMSYWTQRGLLLGSRIIPILVCSTIFVSKSHLLTTMHHVLGSSSAMPITHYDNFVSLIFLITQLQSLIWHSLTAECQVLFSGEICMPCLPNYHTMFPGEEEELVKSQVSHGTWGQYV